MVLRVIDDGKGMMTHTCIMFVVAAAAADEADDTDDCHILSSYDGSGVAGSGCHLGRS